MTYEVHKVMKNDGTVENPRWVWRWAVVRLDGSWTSHGFALKRDAEELLKRKHRHSATNRNK